MSDKIEVPEGFSLIETNQLNSLIEQLKDLRKQLSEHNDLRDTLNNQKVALSKAMNVINFVQSLLPVDSSGQIDVDPMKLFSLISDKKKFAPIMKDLADLETYRKEYENRTVRVIN